MTLPGILQDILLKAREVSASGNSLQVTTEKMIKYLNSYYLYDLPQDLRILKLKDVYTFNTIQGVDVYPFDYVGWSTVQPPAYSAKQLMAFYQDPALFYNSSFNLQTTEQFTSGNGSIGPYSGTTQGNPILRSVNNNPITDTQTSAIGVFPANYPPKFHASTISRVQNILITANTAVSTLNVTDDGNGGLIGDCLTGGTINYFTGVISNLTFTAAVPGGNPIYIEYKAVTLGQPFSILFFQNQFTVRPVPDKGYTIEMIAYRTPSQLLLGTSDPTAPNLAGIPEDYEWWELLAFGIAKKLYQDRLDMQGVAMMQQFIDEKISDARTNTYGQLSKQRAPTIFQAQSGRLNEYGQGVAFGTSVNN